MFNAPWATLATALLLLSAGSANAQQPGAANLERVEVAGRKAEVSKWFRAESQHFVVYSDTREEDVAPLLGNLEKLDHLLRIYTQPVRQSEPQPAKLTLYYHARLSGLREVDDSGPADAVGLYSSCASSVQGFGVHLERIPSLADQELEKSSLNESLSHVFEAYARHFIYRHTDIRTPASFIEGFAQYFSSVRFSEQQMVLGRSPHAIARYLKFLGDGHKYSLEWEDVLEARLSNARNYAGDAGVRLEFEAKSWLLTHYMMSSEDNRRRMGRYLLLVGGGASPTAAFERAFDMKTADMGSVLWRYGLRGTQVLRVEHPALPMARVSFRTLPLAAGEFLLADAALKSCPGQQAGEALLKKVARLAARFPDSEAAGLTLSRAQIDWGDAQQALSRLEAVLRDDDANLEAQHLAGMARLRLAGHSEGEARRGHLQAAQRHLQRANGLSRQTPEAALALFKAEVAATQTPGDATLQGVISAWQAARDVDALGRFAALAHAYAGDADEAYRTLGSLAQDPRDPPMAQWARQWQARLETGVNRGDILAEMQRIDAPRAPLKEWTVDKQSVLQKVERNSGLEAAESFIKEQQRQSQGLQPSNNPGGAEKR
jgi:tetratricopeptide (TPR) repeat protein